jgi:hypothetical protein
LSEENHWRRCSACKNPIALGAQYFVCSVSTCQHKRTGLAFCSVECWEVHLPGANHREAWALDRTAPKRREDVASAPASSSSSGSDAPRRRIIPNTPKAQAGSDNAVPMETLIIGSRLKAYVLASSGLATSDKVMGPLSEIVRKAIDQAIRRARDGDRKTVLDRDIPSP